MCYIGWVSKALAVLAAGALALLSACGKQADTAEPESLRIGFLDDPLASLLYVAQEKGMFQHRNLKVTFRNYEGGAYAVRDLRAGELEVAVCTEFVLALQGFRGSELRTIGTIATADNVEVIARADRGIRLPEDLRGRKVGVSKGMNTEFLLGSFLAFHGLRPRDVRIVDHNPSALVAALASGEVDAACLYPPFSYASKRSLGGQALSWAAQGGQDYFFLLTTSTDLLKARPRAFRELLAALLEAETYLAGHEAEVRELLARRFGLASGPLAERLAQIRFQVGLNQELLTVMEDEAHWAMANGVVESAVAPNLFLALSLEPLETLKPDAVGVIH